MRGVQSTGNAIETGGERVDAVAMDDVEGGEVEGD